MAASFSLLAGTFVALIFAASGQVTKYRITVGSNVCDTDAPDNSCCLFQEDDGYDVIDAGANTLITIETPRDTTIALAGGPGQIIPPLLSRGSYYNGSATPKPAFLMNATYPPMLAGLLFHPTARDINKNARILLHVMPNGTKETGCYHLVAVKVGPVNPAIGAVPLVSAVDVCSTIDPYQQCGGVNLCPLCPLRGGAGSDHVCALPLLPAHQACNGTWPHTCCTEGFVCQKSPGSHNGFDFQCYDAPGV